MDDEEDYDKLKDFSYPDSDEKKSDDHHDKRFKP
jgi:hypothetical protein